MKCNFVVGQKVVLVRDWDPLIRLEAASFGVTMPVKGRVYTVRCVMEVFGELCLYVDEIVNPMMPYTDGYSIGFAEQGFHPDRFRPLETRKTDISIFKAMLTPSKVQVPA